MEMSMVNSTATHAPTFSAPTVSTATHSDTQRLTEAERKLLERFRRLARDGGGRLQVEVSSGRVFFWTVNKEGVSDLG